MAPSRELLPILCKLKSNGRQSWWRYLFSFSRCYEYVYVRMMLYIYIHYMYIHVQIQNICIIIYV